MSEEIKDTSPVSKSDDGTIKVDFSAMAQEAPAEEAVEQPVEEAPAEEPVVEEAPVQEEPVEEIAATAESSEEIESLLTEITDEEVAEVTDELQEEVSEAIAESAVTGVELPENIQKVVDFMSETGGTLEDYVRLNTDYSQLNEDQLLREYYQSSNPHLDNEDIEFMLEDKFSFDEELDDEREVRRKKVERKQALAEAKNHLDGLKSKYYEEIKMGSRLNPEQQKAVEFFNRYNKESEETAKVAERQAKRFRAESDKVFNKDFQGFDYKVGDKTYRFKVKDAEQVKNTQGDINNFVKKFLNENNEMSDAKGYHKSLFTAMNADQVAQHFYEQGKADAMKDSMARTKNVDMNPRGTHEKVTTANGWTIRAVSDAESTSKLKVKFKK
jgi:hypothetical protein